MATSVDYQVQLHEVDASGNVTRMSPKNTSADVLVGSLSAGSLTLPGSSANEMLSDTLKNIKKYLSNLATVAASARGVTSDLTSTSTTDLVTAKAVNDLKTEQDTINSTLSSHETSINGKAPTSHAASDTTYGQATGSLYGHVKTSDTYASKVDGGAAANGVAASQNAVYNAYNALNTSKAPTDHAVAATTYGQGTATLFGHVKISDTYASSVDGANAAGGIAASQNAVYNAYNALKVTVDDHTNSINSKAPTNHAATATTYGAGSSVNFGHVQLSDNYSSDTSATGAAANGVAASNWAVYRAYTAAIGDANTKINSHEATRGTASAFGHVKLSDNYTSSAGAASASVGASSKAVYDCYATLLSSITSLQNSVDNLNSVIEEGLTMTCIKSIQRGTGNASTTNFTINEVNPEKCVVIINPIITTSMQLNTNYELSYYGYCGPWGNSYGGATLSSITATELSFTNVKNTFGWQLIEFA